MIRNRKLIKGFTKIITYLTIAAALTLTGTVPSFAAETAQPSLDSTSAILMDAGSGEILYEKNAYEKRDPASITKILNCMVVLDTLDMDREVTVDIEPETEGSIMKLAKGEKITVKNLVYGMMLGSANDAAEFLGYLAGGDMKTFCSMMNERAASCGANDTVYTNPNGLNDKKVNNVTTAYDIAIIARSAMNNEKFREIVSTPKYIIPATNKSEERKLKNSDRCLWDTKTKVRIDGVQTPLKYDGCIGIKTGYSSTAGDCFAGCAVKGETELISVVLNAPHEKEKFRDTVNLWNYGFSNFRTYTAAKAGEVQCEQKVRRGSLREVDLGIEKDLKITVKRGSDPEENVTVETKLKNNAVTAPVRKGDVLGEIIVYDSGKEAARARLTALESAGTGGPLSYIGIADEDVPEFLLLVAAAVLTLLLIIVLAKKRKKNV